MMPRRRAVWIAVAAGLVLALAAAAGLRAWRARLHEQAQLQHRLASIVAVGQQPRLDCRTVAAARPLVLLALGQSNAANHGEFVPGRSAELTVLAEGHCLRAGDPLPGGTGEGGSIWSRLEPALRERGVVQPLVLSVLAIDASSIGEWTRGPIAQRLQDHLRTMQQRGLAPTLVLWQQGEADARLGTPQAEYERGLQALAQIITQGGSGAPILVARSTVCRSGPSAPVRAAVAAALAGDRRLRPGPDTDLLTGPEHRRDNCHFNAHGLERAARAWADAIARAVPQQSS